MGLLVPAFSNQQIAHEACEIYYGYNTFESSVELLPFDLKNKLYLTGGVWFFPAMWIRAIRVRIYTPTYQLQKRADDLRMLFRCSNLQRLVFDFCAMSDLDHIRRRGSPTRIETTIDKGRKLIKDLGGFMPELHLENLRFVNSFTPNPDMILVTVIDESENVTWLFDKS